ncbi:MAG TPA: hypothetical protein VFL13_08665, partial [Candidatus Baltobacteraceae bacterium]|nr:hypothetical protein [Candidatus Baltobacteraceae bacterium]
MLETTLRRILFALCAGAMISGCSNTSSPAPTTPTVANISGDYTGTVTDSVHGNYTATATLAQHSSTAGGTIAQQQAGAVTDAQVILSIGASNAVSGTMVVDYVNGTTCTFGTTGTYNS